MTRLTPYDSSINTRLREMWSCICKIQQGGDSPVVTQNSATITFTGNGTSGSPLIATYVGPAGATGANPTATLGLTAINGAAATFMRSDAAPALSQAIVPTWTGIHTFSGASSGTTSGVTVLAATPQFELNSTLSAANNKRWITYSGATAYVLAAASDDGATLNDVHRVQRSGAIVQTQTWNTTGVGRMVLGADGTLTLPTIAALTATAGATLSLKSTAPVLEIWNPGGSGDQKRWMMTGANTGNFILRTINDDGTNSSAGIAMQVFRNGGTIQDVQLLVSSGTPRIKITATATTILGRNENPVQQATAVTLTTAQSGSIVHNTGAAGSITYTLPVTSASTIGVMYEFINLQGTALVVAGNGADTIRRNDGIEAANINSASTMDNAKVVCIAAGKWVIMGDPTGDWT